MIIEEIETLKIASVYSGDSGTTFVTLGLDGDGELGYQTLEILNVWQGDKENFFLDLKAENAGTYLFNGLKAEKRLHSEAHERAKRLWD